MNYKIDYKVKDIRLAPELNNIKIGGRIEKQMETFFYERVTSDFAKNYICAEAESKHSERIDDETVVGMFSGEFWGKWAIGACRVARYQGNKELTNFLKASAYRIIDTADSDGYIGSYKKKENVFPSDPDEAFKAVGRPLKWNWNLWCRKYTLWGLLEIYLLTEDKKILDAAYKAAIQEIVMLNKLNAHTADTGTFEGLPSGSTMKPMLILYRLTGDKRCLDFAQKTADDWDRADGKMPNIVRNSIDMKPVHEWYPNSEKWAKAYEMMSCFDGLLELYRVTGDKKYLDAGKNIHKLLLEHEQNILFSVGFNDMFSNAAKTQNALTEPCDVIHWMRLCYELYKLTGELEYIDSFELAFYNAFLSSSFADGKWGARCVRSWGRPFVATMQSGMKYNHCCVNNIPRGYINALEAFVSLNNDDIFVNLYSDYVCKINGYHVIISGSLFKDGNVKVFINSNMATVVHFRIPKWSKATTINDKKYGCDREAVLPISEGENVFYIKFDMKAEIRDFPYSVEAFDECDHRVTRFLCSSSNTSVSKEHYATTPHSTLLYGPLLLSKSKLIGNTRDEMFGSESVFGKGFSAEVTPIDYPGFAGNAYNVKFVGEGGFETVLCDYANASNRWFEDDAEAFNVLL